jgi:hypothetical protein
MRHVGVLVTGFVLVLESTAFAQDPAPPLPPATEPAPAPATPPPPAEPPPVATPPAPTAPPPPAMNSDGSAPAAESAEKPVTGPRDSGVRLGLELGFQRASTSTSDNVTAGTPSLIPIGAELAFHTSATMLWGLHGYAALASRDDCLRSDDCTGRGYGLGGQLEVALGRGPTFMPFFRYGIGWETIYHGGLIADRGGHTYRSGFDLVDARLGADFVVARGAEGKTSRIGGYLGMIAGVQLSESGGTSGRNGSAPQSLDSDGGVGYVWFTLGVRGNMDF